MVFLNPWLKMGGLVLDELGKGKVTSADLRFCATPGAGQDGSLVAVQVKWKQQKRMETASAHLFLFPCCSPVSSDLHQPQNNTSETSQRN